MEAGDRKDEDAPSDTEQERRRDEVLRRMLNTPPKPHKRHDAGKPEDRPERGTNPRKAARGRG